MNLTLCVYILILLVILLWNAKITKQEISLESAFSLTITKGMQGFFALCILIHHVALALRDTSGYHGELEFFENQGVLYVGFFFFCSGYGLLVSYETKKDYLQTFVIRRVLTVLVPFFICNYAYMITTLLLGHKFSNVNLVKAFFGILLLNDHMWFAVEIMILYMVFFLLFRYMESNRLRYGLMLVFIIAMMTLSFFSGHNIEGEEQAYWFKGEWWYDTTPLFFVGLLVGKNRQRIESFIQKFYPILLSISAVLFVVLYLSTNYMLKTRGYWSETIQNPAYDDKLLTLLVQVPMVITFVGFWVLIMLKVKMSNPLLTFLGKISLEMILLEKVFMLLFSEAVTTLTPNAYCLVVITATIVIATGINKVKLLILEKK